VTNVNTESDGTIGRQLRSARQRLGLTQQELATRAGLSLGALRDLEQGRSRHPRLPSIRALGDVLGLSHDDQARLRALAERPRREPATVDGPLRIGVLGPLTVRRSDTEVPVGAGRHRVVLARLALTPNRPVGIEELTRLVWPDGQPATASNVLQAHVSRIRRALDAEGPAGAPTTVTFGPAGYCLQADDDVVDLLAYRNLISKWRSTATVDPQRAFDGLHEALSLWRAAVPAEDVPELRDHPIAIALCDESVQMTAQLGMLGESLHRLSEAFPLLRRFAAHHEWHEGLQARLIVALAASGQQAAALQAYESMRRRLADELGIDPGPELREARQTVLEQRLAGRPAAPAAAGPGPAQLQLPAPPSDFIGRSSELHRLEQAVSLSSQRLGARSGTLCVVSGMPGVGKTSLALQAAQRLRPEFSERPLYLDLRGADHRPVGPSEALSRLLRALGVDRRQIPDEADRARKLYRDVLADRRVLLILDNARDADQVRPLLPEHDGGNAVVVTSRNECAELDGAVRLSVPPLSVDESVELLGCGVRTEQLGPDRRAAQAVVEACGRLPLAIRVANRRLASAPDRTVTDLLEELQRTSQPAASASFDLSYRQLDPRTATVFRTAALIPGETFSPAAAAALTGEPVAEVESTLRSLVQDNLVQRAQSGHYRFHDLLRAYAGRRLAATEDLASRAAALGRLSEWYLAGAAAAMRLLYPSMVRLPTDVDDRPMWFDDVDSALAWLNDEADNLIALIETLADAPHPHRAWQLADQLRGYFFVHRDAVRWLTSSQIGLDAALRAGDRRAEAAMHQTLGQAHWSAGRHQLALETYQRGITAAAESGWTVGHAYLLHNVGLIHAEMGRVTEAKDLYQQALACCAGDEFTHVRAVTLNDLGALCNEQGQLPQAVDYFTSALQLNHSSARRPSAMANHSNLGMVLRQLEDFEAARVHLETALDYHRSTGSMLAQLSTLDELSHLYRQQGQLPAALDAATEAFRFAERLGDQRSQAGTRVTLGSALLASRAVTDARAQFDEALRLSREHGLAYFETQAGVGVADAAFTGGDLETARAAATEALRTARHKDYRVLAGDAYVVLARTALAVDDHQAAAEHHRSAARAYATSGLPAKQRALDQLEAEIPRPHVVAS
jgi:DNA-binding SARP family transcriptional activator/Tfp pilus assembly protein PilF/DNA-binding XRE family transcriptional regulator